jgi:cell division septal protein FtsQ
MLRHSTLIKIFIVSGIIIFLIIVWLVIVNSNYIFSLKKFYITGNRYISFDEILSLSGLKYSEPLANIDSARIEQELKINPFIESIIVKVYFLIQLKSI